MKKRVVALGFFDGVHIGHASLLRRAKSIAEREDAVAAVMTYSRHPSEIVGKAPVRLINTTYERCRIISDMFGISDIIVKDFTREYASLSCEDFIDKIIIEELSACYVVAGFDFRFGFRGAGDADTLIRLCEERGVGCDIVDEVDFDGAPVSSSRIRELIAEGDVERAADMLGHYHCIISEVVRGASLGHRLGFPTANQELSENVALPKFGVYLSRVTLDGKVYTGVTNIGIKPTVTTEARPAAETNILDFSGNIYGRKMTLELIKFMRAETKFTDTDTLKMQVDKDVAEARKEFRRLF